MIKSSFFGDKDIGVSERRLVREFDGYLSSVVDRRLAVFTSEGGGCYDIPYCIRWSHSYKRRMIAKMYGVEEYLTKKSMSGVVTLVTLTGYQGGLSSVATKGHKITREQLFNDMKRGWCLLSNLLSKVSPGLEYVWVMEPHKSGYPHMHVAVFGYISGAIQERLKHLWSQKYAVGSKEHGLDFSVKSVKESIQSVRNYLMKYITKGIGGDGKKKWSVEEWVYHALAWKHRHRFVGMSRGISRYCTARSLRYKYIHYLHSNDITDITILPVPVSKDGIEKAIRSYCWRLPIDHPKPPELRWHCIFATDPSRGTAELVRRNGQISPTDTQWINDTLCRWVGMYDTFLKPPVSPYQIAPVSDQVYFNL